MIDHPAFQERVAFLTRKREVVELTRFRRRAERNMADVPMPPPVEDKLFNGPAIEQPGVGVYSRPAMKKAPYTPLPGGGVKYRPRRY